MSTRPTAEQRRQVTERAQDRCEYCLFQQMDAIASHQIDHVIADKHGGETSLENLALSCMVCNRRKASDLTSIDPEGGELTALFNPRTQVWNEHFRVQGLRIVGITSVGRTTSHFLEFNSPQRIAERRELQLAGRFPPTVGT